MDPMPRVTREYEVQWDSWYRVNGKKVFHTAKAPAVDLEQAKVFVKEKENPRIMFRSVSEWQPLDEVCCKGET